jgi:DNA-binding transcriptional ArsR family regulator
MSEPLANAARLMAEPARAAILLQLMGGRAVPAGELAMSAHVSPQTASEHLARLSQAGFIIAHRQGRHRYYRLATDKVAYAVESLMVLSSAPRELSSNKMSRPMSRSLIGSFEHARTCYTHLAGWLGVAITDALQRADYLAPAPGSAFAVTRRGRTWFAQQGILVPHPANAPDPKLARQCLDWTERRPHLAGTLGVDMYKRFCTLRWIAPIRGSRTVRVTVEGQQAFLKHLHITVG